MSDASSPRELVRFGVFELDLRCGEMRRQGLRIRLQEQPFQVLAMLLERPGELVTREELRKKLWPADTFVDFERGLNKDINKIREALGDTAGSPRFIETVPRRGYRFVAPVGGISAPVAAVAAPELNISRGAARRFFVFIQAGYLAMYGAALLHLPAIEHLQFLSRVRNLGLIVALYLICCAALRIYLLAAVALDYPDSGRLFRRLFLAILLADLAWAASPLLLFEQWGGVTLLFVAGLAFLPFSQRSLLFSAYLPGGGRVSSR